MTDHHFAGECSDGTLSMISLSAKEGNVEGETKLARTLFLEVPCGYCGVKHLTRISQLEYEQREAELDGKHYLALSTSEPNVEGVELECACGHRADSKAMLVHLKSVTP